MEYTLLPDGTIEVTEVLFDRRDVMSHMVAVGAVAHYWYETSNKTWWCLNNTGDTTGIDDLDPEIDYEDLPDVVKLAAMLK